jgi:hypothetical protein
VSVKESIVWLKGFTSNREQCELAVKAAQRAEGVKAVVNELTVREADEGNCPQGVCVAQACPCPCPCDVQGPCGNAACPNGFFRVVAGPGLRIAGCMAPCSDVPPGAVAEADLRSNEELLASLRQSSRLLSERSHALEAAGRYVAADEARALSDHLRIEARLLSGTPAALHCQPCPLPGYQAGFPMPGPVGTPSHGYRAPGPVGPVHYRVEGCPVEVLPFPAPHCPAPTSKNCPGGNCANAESLEELFGIKPAATGPSGFWRLFDGFKVEVRCENGACEKAARDKEACVKRSPEAAAASFDLSLPTAWFKAAFRRAEPRTAGTTEDRDHEAERTAEREQIFQFFQGFTR